MPNINISINTSRAMGLTRSRTIGSDAGRWLRKVLDEVVSGWNQSDGFIWNAEDTTVFGSNCCAGPSCGALIGSTLSGSVGGTIDGTAVTVTAAGGDAATQTLLAAAIRANTSVNRKVTATNLGMQLTLASVTAGQYVDVCGIRFTAVNGTPTDFGAFDMSGTDTADATSLALAINRHPRLAMKFRAVSSTGIVYVFPSTPRTCSAFERLSNPGGFSTITLNTPTQTALAVCGVMSLVPGAIGDCCTVAASGTGMTYATANAGKLGGGTGGGAVSYLVNP